MAVKITQVDTFTDRPFTGNPAAVVILSDLPTDAWMQDVAREMNLSETAFLLPHEEGFDLRWFTPHVEVDLCGHATLASAHVLWEDGIVSPQEEIRFHTRGGELRAWREQDWIAMEFPIRKAHEIPLPEELPAALGVHPVWIGRSEEDLLAVLGSEKQVRSLRPDPLLLRRLNARGVIVTSEAVSAGSDFVSRFFAPRVGVDEDPVTGSAHCTLAPYWEERLGRTNLIGYQVSSRGGKVRTRVNNDRVEISGQAVTVLQLQLL